LTAAGCSSNAPRSPQRDAVEGERVHPRGRGARLNPHGGPVRRANMIPPVGIRPPHPRAWCSLAAGLVLASGTLAAQAGRPSPADSLDLLLDAAEAHHFQGAFAEAYATLARAESAARGTSAPSALARVWIAWTRVCISETTVTNAGYPEADSSAARARRYAEESREPRLIADATDLTGRVLYARRINLNEGDYDRPLAYFTRALTLRKGVGDTRGVVESLFRVGLIHERKDQSAPAIALYEQAMRLAGDAYPVERSNLARHLAYQRQAQGDLDRAIELFELSLALREEVGLVITRPSALTSLADAYRRKGNSGRALEYGRRALEDAERLAADRFAVGALISLGQTHAATGDRSAALEQLRRADSLAARIGYVSGATRARAEQEKLTASPSGSETTPGR